MPGCPHYEKCFPDLYEKRFSSDLDAAVITVERYCQDRYAYCARYALYRQMPAVPWSILPNQTRAAQQLLVRSQYQTAARKVYERYVP